VVLRRPDLDRRLTWAPGPCRSCSSSTTT
jgi:hypothetical protein